MARIPQSPRAATLIGVMVLGLAGCGTSGNATGSQAIQSTPPASDSSATSSAPEPSETAANPFTPYADAEGDHVSVRVAQSVPSLSFVPLLVAQELNFFGHQGVDLDFRELEGGATAMQALIGGSVNMVDSASLEVLGAVAGGADLVMIQGTINMTMQVCAYEDWIEERGISDESSLDDRLAALRGATVGITGPGAISDRAMRWLLTRYGGINPDTDAVFTQIGGPQALAVALDEGAIQSFMFAPPWCHVSGENATVLVSASDVPEFANYHHQVLYVTREWLDANPEAARRTATALSMGNNFVIQYPEETLKFLQEGPFSNVDPSFVEAAFYDLILPQIEAVEDGLMTEDAWTNTNEVLVESGVIEEPLDATEGGFWTNEYIDVEAAQIR